MKKCVFVNDPDTELRFTDSLAMMDGGDTACLPGFRNVSKEGHNVKPGRFKMVVLEDDDAMITVFIKDFPAAVLRKRDLSKGNLPSVLLCSEFDIATASYGNWRLVDVDESGDDPVPAGTSAFRVDAPDAFGGIGTRPDADGSSTYKDLAADLALSNLELAILA